MFLWYLWFSWRDLSSFPFCCFPLFFALFIESGLRWQLYQLLWARIPSKKWSSPHSQQQSRKCSGWVQSQKWQNDLCSKPFSITVIQAYAPNTNAEEVEVEWFYEALQDLLELTPQRDVLFIMGDWNAKVRSQKIPGITGKFGLGVQNEAGKG